MEDTMMLSRVIYVNKGITFTALLSSVPTEREHCTLCILRCFHSSHRRTLPGERRAHSAARGEGGGGPVSVQSQHPEAGLCRFAFELGGSAFAGMLLRQLGLPQPGGPSDEGRWTTTHPDCWKTGRLQPSGGSVVLQRSASLPQPLKTVALFFKISKDSIRQHLIKHLFIPVRI